MKPKLDKALMLCHRAPMDKKHLTPVDVCLLEFGGVRKLAKALGRDPAAISRWKRLGTVPSAVQRKLLEVAAARGLNITALDVIFGRDVE